MNKRRALTIGGAVTAFLVVAQLVPFSIDNPPVTGEPTWDAPRTEQLARQACFDCHSNEVVVPWYGHVAPISWWMGHHVDEGREHLNFSELDKPQRDADEAGETVREHEMPMASYTWMHPEAKLSDADRKVLADGLDATFGEH
jgi:mono/diheme cytochrome c family protein